ncbi:hypothetical protein VCHC17A1_4082B, partial [Vibrio cholerae HC-17A1]
AVRRSVLMRRKSCLLSLRMVRLF